MTVTAMGPVGMTGFWGSDAHYSPPLGCESAYALGREYGKRFRNPWQLAAGHLGARVHVVDRVPHPDGREVDGMTSIPRDGSNPTIWIKRGEHETFVLAHECAHLVLGRGATGRATYSSSAAVGEEQCDAFARAFLEVSIKRRYW